MKNQLYGLILSAAVLMALLTFPANAHRPIFSDAVATNATTAVNVHEPDVSHVIYRTLRAGHPR